MTLHAITTYFNPCGYKSRRANYDRFRSALDNAGVPCLTVEAAFGDAPFDLEPALGVVQLRTDSLLWQKERLLNLAASWLPRRVTSVAWLDADILFQNTDWPKDLRRALTRAPVAQLWSTCHRLGPFDAITDDRVVSFAQRMQSSRSLLDVGRYDAHGHTGYAWAMRRDIFDSVGLYEGGVVGNADHFLGHAIYDCYNHCIVNALKHDAKQIEHLRSWGERFYARVRGQLAVVPGEIEHLWHGDLADRQYFSRMHVITDLGYNPWTDIVAPAGRPLEWSDGTRSTKPELCNYFNHYFQSRKEDGYANVG
jgi:hypothetical protein